MGILFLSLIGVPATPDDAQAAWPEKAIPLEAHSPRLEDALMAMALGRLADADADTDTDTDDGVHAGAGAQGATATAAGDRAASRIAPEGGAVRVIVEPEGSPAFVDEAALRALGASIEARSRRLLRVRLPPARLGELARLPGVRRVRRASAYVEEALPVSQAVTPLGATLFHSFDYQGQGVSIAVIDVGFASLEYARRRGALPSEVIAGVRDYSFQGLDGGTNHGTAVALVVHQMAPQARLYLKRVNDEVDLENAVEDALDEGVRIIVHSVGWVNTNFSDGTGMISQLADRARAAGVLWVNAAGNHAQNHWAGLLRDADGDGWAEFVGSGESLRLAAYFGSLIRVFLTWDDWPRTAQDLDLFLYDNAGRLVASSTGWQTGFEPPVEELQFFVEKTDVYHLKVLSRRVSRPIRIKLFSFNHRLIPHTAYGSLLAPADARGALAVGAVAYYRWESGPQEPFSSLGPTSDGRIKPDLVGPDGVANLLINPFSGTSAAAPHVAGAAALLWSRHPGWGVEEIWSALEGEARDLGPPGKDPVFGAGRLSLVLAHPSAVRRLESPQVRAGEAVRVTLTVRMPPFRFGALTLEEQPPAGFLLEPQDHDGGRYDPQAQRWTWPALTPGSSRTVTYLLRIPPDQAPGRYRLRGRVNGRQTGGDGELEVLPPPAEGAPGSKAEDRIEGDEDPVKRVGVLRLSPVTVTQPLAGARAVRFEFEVEGPVEGFWVEVYDLAGRRLYRSPLVRGSLRWAGVQADGRPLANGVYLYRLAALEPDGGMRLFLGRLVVLR